jgi:methylase of polypeptide subunit release factors
MAFSLRDYLYRTYASGPSSWAHKLHRVWFRSPRTARWHFGLQVLPRQFNTYFDLTTVLMRELLAARVRRNPGLRILEVGVGGCALLSGHLSRLATHPIDAIDIREDCVASSRRHVELNRVTVNVFQSDLFGNVPPQQYDLIFWNLPYYKSADTFLGGLFKQVPDHLSDRGELVIGYNGKSMPRAAALRILDEHPRLRLVETVTWWWNLHEVLVIGKR